MCRVAFLKLPMGIFLRFLQVQRTKWFLPLWYFFFALDETGNSVILLNYFFVHMGTHSFHEQLVRGEWNRCSAFFRMKEEKIFFWKFLENGVSWKGVHVVEGDDRPWGQYFFNVDSSYFHLLLREMSFFWRLFIGRNSDDRRHTDFLHIFFWSASKRKENNKKNSGREPGVLKTFVRTLFSLFKKQRKHTFFGRFDHHIVFFFSHNIPLFRLFQQK